MIPLDMENLKEMHKISMANLMIPKDLINPSPESMISWRMFAVFGRKSKEEYYKEQLRIGIEVADKGREWFYYP